MEVQVKGEMVVQVKEGMVVQVNVVGMVAQVKGDEGVLAEEMGGMVDSVEMVVVNGEEVLDYMEVLDLEDEEALVVQVE